MRHALKASPRLDDSMRFVAILNLNRRRPAAMATLLSQVLFLAVTRATILSHLFHSQQRSSWLCDYADRKINVQVQHLDRHQRLFSFHKSCRSGVVWCTHLYDFIITAWLPPAGRKNLRPAPGVPESIVIQLQPQGRELIILRFTGIIEQMCFEIGHRAIAAPTVVPQPGLPHSPKPDPHGL